MLAADQLPEDVFGAPVIHPELAIQAYTIGLFPMSDDRDDSNVHWVDPIERGGLLGQASLLTLTSYPTRTSPVLRGKWVLDNLLAMPPSPPPPDEIGRAHV